MLIVFAIRGFLIWKSIGESQDNDGERLTSINQGLKKLDNNYYLRSESIKISNPKSSKQFDLE